MYFVLGLIACATAPAIASEWDAPGDAEGAEERAGAARSREAVAPYLDRRLLVDSFDDVVAVGRGGAWHCSGIVVAPDAVLTARHCLPAERVGVGRDIRDLERVIDVVDASAPPDRSLDVAVLELRESVAVRIRPRRAASDDRPPQGILQVVGFGAADIHGRFGRGRRRVTTLTTSGWTCTAEEARRTGCSPEHELVVYGQGGRDSCDGDSGGPILELHLGGAPGERAWRLLGITSRTVASARVRCGEGGVYTRVDAMHPWLEATLAEARED